MLERKSAACVFYQSLLNMPCPAMMARGTTDWLGQRDSKPPENLGGLLEHM